MVRRLTIAVIVVPMLMLLPGCGGQRLIEARVERDGEPVLQSQFGIGDEATPAAAWGELAGLQFKAVGMILPESQNAHKAVLKGKIRIVLRHAGSPYASVEVEQLTLARHPTAEDRWEIPSAEVERTRKAAGF